MKTKIALYMSMYIFTESNASNLGLTTADFKSWRFYHMFNETPTEVTFIGQRVSNFINIEIYHNSLITVCEVEASGRYFFHILPAIPLSIYSIQCLLTSTKGSCELFRSQCLRRSCRRSRCCCFRKLFTFLFFFS